MAFIRPTAALRAAAAAAVVVAVLGGRILDQTTRQPLPGIRVSVSGPTHAAATTGSDGRYTVRGLRPGTYIVTISGKDVPAIKRTVNIRGTANTGNFTVCSTTLDYSCNRGGPGSGPGAGG